MLGTDFPYRQFFPEKATIVQIDIRGEQLGRRAKVDHGFVGDTQTTLRALLPQLDTAAGRQAPRGVARTLPEGAQGPRRARRPASRARSRIHPQYVARVVDELAADDAIFSCDVGTPTVWAARYLTMNGKRRLLGSFNHGSMANALPQAIGAQVSHPGRKSSRCRETAAWRCSWAICSRSGNSSCPVKIDRVQERRAGLCRAGDEGGRHPRLRDRPAQPGFRQDGRGRRPAGADAPKRRIRFGR